VKDERNVVWLLDVLEEAGVEVWLDGGWGVDALLAGQTRPHHDVDVIVRAEDVAVITDMLAQHSFSRLTDVLLTHGACGRVDLQPVRFDSAGNAVGAKTTYPAGSLIGIGSLGGREVRCVTVDHQVLAHMGYEPRDVDRSDINALHDRFGVLLPPGYETPS
jgi:lincosamide nucleotidyltransferase A/C/D/E